MKLQAKKRFGQNFLQDKQVIGQIINAINPAMEQNLVEIGPGRGAITLPIIENGYPLTVIELDRTLIPALRVFAETYPNLTVREGDALKFDYPSLGNNLRLFGNLPYNISTPLLFNLFEVADCFSDATFMLQKEVADRLASPPGSKQYGRLSVMAQYHCQVEKLFEVPPTAFIPAPKVTSAIVQLKPKQNLPLDAAEYERFAEVIKLAFGQRRKTLRNALRDCFTAEALEAKGVAPTARAETLTLEQFIGLARED